MRLLELDLDRYGPFTGERLGFRRDARVHVVYGANEAGKSCALAAVTDLLFGIERQTRYDFEHDGKELRIGATIIGAGGASLRFVRRKNKPVLTDADDRPLPDTALAPFLGGLSREVFRRAFGLDPAGLRASGDELRQSDGELGASLFAAASGLRGLHNLRAALDEEAAAIFAPKASSKRRFYEALKQYEDARHSIRERELRAGDWKDVNEKAALAARRLDDIAQLRGANAAEQARILRLKRAAPILRLIDADEAALALLGALPPTPAGSGQLLHQALAGLASAGAARQEAAETQERIAREHDDMAVDDALLAAAADVEALFAQTGSYGKSRSDLPRVEGEVRDLAAELQSLAVRLGLSAEHGMVEQEQPSDATLAQVRELAREGHALDGRLGALREDVRKEREELRRLQQQRAERGHLVDPRPVREQLAALAPLLARLTQREAAGLALAADRRAVQEAAARLSPPVEQLDALAAAPLPRPETIQGVRDRLDELRNAIRREGERADRAGRESEAIEQRLHDLGAAGPVPTPETLLAARAAREAQWGRLRGALFGDDILPAAALAETVARFERLGAEADRLADAAAADAERIATHLGEVRRLAVERKAQSDAQMRLAGCEQELRTAAEEWRAAWAGAGITPRSPAEMAVWLATLGNLLERRAALEARRDAAASLDAQAGAVQPALAAMAAELGLAPMPALDPLLAARRIEEQLKTSGRFFDDARELDVRLGAAAERLKSAEAAEHAAAGQLEDWLARWATAAPEIGLPSTASPGAAAAALEAWKEVPRALRERENRTRRVAGMHRDIEAFESAAELLVGAHAPDLAAFPADAAVNTLRQRVQETQRAQTRRHEKAAQLAAARSGHARAAQRVVAAEQHLADHVARLGGADGVGCADGERLAALADRLVERDRLKEALRKRRDDLANAADGHAEDVLRGALAGFDADAAEIDLARLRQADETLDGEGKHVFADKDRHERQLAEWEGGVGAEVALQQRRGAEAELTHAARDYAVLKLGSLLIDAALERQRSSRQDPLMRRSGVLFRSITGGAFDGLAQEFDDDDLPHLAGRRPSGRTTRVGDMSEGTRDQLYLALRLAYLEDYAGRSEPAPFICDDLFASFDDERTAHGLQTLAAIGSKVQTILFTHHRHVVEIARARLGSAADIVELGRTPPLALVPAPRIAARSSA